MNKLNGCETDFPLARGMCAKQANKAFHEDKPEVFRSLLGTGHA